MDIPFVKKYSPVPQQEMVESPDDVERSGSTTPLENESWEKSYPYDLRYIVRPAWARWIPWFLTLFLVLLNSYTWLKLRACNDEGVFSPAASVLKYKNVVFTAGIENDKSPYQGRPTEENNRLWEDLYDFGVTRIPTSQAVQLTNRTSPIGNDEGHYVVILDVFHQLHCLNMLRKRIFWNESMPEDKTMSMLHIDHCIDSIRQSLMCFSDITPIPYAWWPKYQKVLPTAGVMHTCRDFGAIQDWARKRRATKFDKNTHVENPLGEVIHVSPVE